MLVTLITPTGGRPEAFALCEKLIQRQTFRGNIQWLVSDDCTPRTKVHFNQTYMIGPEEWKPGFNTQRFNMEMLLTKAKGDYIFVIEDDDFYAPTYLHTMIQYLQTNDIVGLGNSQYYNVGVPGWKIMTNFAHASLSQTAFKKSLLPTLLEAVNSGEFFFDIYLWRKARERRLPWTLIHNSNISIGMKGMKGRTGITTSHKEKDFHYDTNYSKLESWIGRDIELYRPFLRPFSKNRVRSSKTVNV